MSADRWRDCPFCGKGEAFREDFEIYSGDGECKEIEFDYGGYCTECKVHFNHSHKVTMNDKKKENLWLQKNGD